jgi:hypothetical protein
VDGRVGGEDDAEDERADDDDDRRVESCGQASAIAAAKAASTKASQAGSLRLRVLLIADGRDRFYAADALRGCAI